MDLSPVTGHRSPVTCHLSPVIGHLSPVTCHLSPVTLSPCHPVTLSPVTCPVSSVTCQVSPVTCHLSLVITRTARATDPPLCNTSTMHCSWTENTMLCKGNHQKKNYLCAAILDHFQAKNVKPETTFFHYFYPRIPNI